jgi:hypothetical protein
MYLNRKNFTFIKRIREPSFCEPNLCEPSSPNYSVNFDLWFTCFHSTKISREPVNHGSQITSAPTCIGFKIRWILFAQSLRYIINVILLKMLTKK